MGLFKKNHGVAVYDTRPAPDDPDPWEPYFIAICECGWTGQARDTSEEAFADAFNHDKYKVSEEIVRPIG